MRIDINVNQVTARVDTAWKNGLAMLTSEVARNCNEFCKLKDGNLRGSALRNSDSWAEGKIIWDAPYARRQYWSIPTAYEPGTCWQWCEAAKAAYSQQWADQAQRLLEMNL